MTSYKTKIETEHKVTFPNQRELLMAFIRNFSESALFRNPVHQISFENYFKSLDMIQEIMLDYKSERMASIFNHSESIVDYSKQNIEELTGMYKNMWPSRNEFYALFDIKSGQNVFIDPGIEAVLGIAPENFRMTGVQALDPVTSIYYNEDVFALLRFSLVGYLCITLPGFNWRSFQDHYVVQYRFNTRDSNSKLLREKPYVVIEKRCYFGYLPDGSEIPAPNYHLDRYTVYPDREIDHVTRSFVTCPEQNSYINGFNYLFNSYLLQLSPKHILLLDERCHNDRYKAIANALNEKSKALIGRELIIDEHQVADCFSKTIRSKIQQLMLQWNHRKVYVESDQDAIKYATALGLLPLPNKIRDLIYRML